MFDADAENCGSQSSLGLLWLISFDGKWFDKHFNIFNLNNTVLSASIDGTVILIDTA